MSPPAPGQGAKDASGRRLRVGVIFGGRSVEHEVSLISARSVMEALDPVRFEVVPIGITSDGRWLSSGDPMAVLTDRAAASEEAGSARIVLRAQPAIPGTAHNGTGPPLDVVFPLVHGIFGEDGTMQGLLEMADLPYVGAGVLGSAMGMDKEVSKRLFERAGLPVAAYRVLRLSDWLRDGESNLEGLSGDLGFPCFVKPAGSGSSVGVTKVREASALPEAIALAFEYDRKVLIECAIDAREIEVAVLGNDEPVASVPGEIVPCHEFYDYEAKYIDRSELIVPAALSPSQASEARGLALAAFRVLELAGLARVDLFLDRASGRFVLNEVNTLPGFTPVSMYPRLWEATGLPYRQLISRLVDLALERSAQRKALKTTFSPRAGSHARS